MPTIAEYEAWQARKQQSNVGKANIVLSQPFTSEPDQFAADLHLAKDASSVIGNPVPPMMMADPVSKSVFQRIVEEKKRSTILSSSPRLTEWLRVPDNAALGRDDLEGLSWWERMGKSFQTGNATAIVQGQEFTRDASAALEGGPLGQAMDVAQDVLRPLLSNPDGTPNYLGHLANMVRPENAQIGGPVLTAEQRKEAILSADFGPIFDGARSMLAQMETDGFEPTGLSDVNSFGSAAQFVADNLALSGPQMLTAIASGAFAPLVQVAMLGGEANTELKKRTELSVDQRIAVATGAGVVMTALETFGMGYVFKGLPVGGVVGDALDGVLVEQLISRGVPAIAARALEAAIAEGTTEALQEAIVVGVTSLSGGKYTSEEVSARLIEAFVAGGAVGGSIRGASEVPATVERAGQRLQEQQAAAAAAETTTATLTEMAANAAASPLRNRMPDSFRDYLQSVTAGTSSENMFVPAAAFTEYFQGAGIDPFEVAETLNGLSRADLQTAIDTGGAVKIPTATWAADMAGGPHDQFIIENSAFAPDAMTAFEAAEFNANVQQLQQEAFEEAEAARVSAEQYRQIYEIEREELIGHLRAAGRATDVAATEALPMVEFRRVMAERMGLTPEEFAARYPLPEVRGERPEGLDPKNVDALTRTLAEARARRAVGLEKRGPTILEFISERGGVIDPGGELKARDAAVIKRKGKKTLKLERAGLRAAGDMFGLTGSEGHGLDDVARAAIDAGYMAGDPLVLEWQEAQRAGTEAPDITRALLAAIDRELAGAAEYAETIDQAAALEQTDGLDSVEEYLAGLGVSLEDADDAIRAAIEGGADGRAYGQPAYHGTPHLFEKFSTDKIGTGEGNQAFGWGLYFAGRREVAEFYRSKLGGPLINGKSAWEEMPWMGRVSKDHANAAVRKAIEAGLIGDEAVQSAALEVNNVGHETNDNYVRQSYYDAANAIYGLMGQKWEWATGRVFEVDIPQDSELLIWDLPLSEQPENVREAVEKVTDRYMLRENARAQAFLLNEGDVERQAARWYAALSRAVGSDKAASAALQEAGIPGHRYLDGGSRDNGDGTYNYVIYDDTRVSVRSYEQADAGFTGGGRGSIQFPSAGISNGETLVSLFQKADLSTFLHESGHYFLTVMRDAASLDPEGAIAKEFETVKSWWRDNADAVARDAGNSVTADDVRNAIDNGTSGDTAKDLAIDTGMQEQFARATEAYMLEGKAPSPSLRQAFEKFRAWLVSIYKTMRGLNVNVTDEMRGVFDRMLATDEEIAQARQDIGADVALTASDLGMTDEQFQGFLKLRDQAKADASAKLLAETMAPIQRAREQWFKDERKKVHADVERNTNAQPVYRAMEWMGNRRWLGDDAPENLPDIRFSKAVLVDRYGEGVLATLPRGQFTVYAVDGGVDPDDAAGWFGFSSGDAMVQAMERAPNRKEFIEAETDKVMRERHGDVLRDGSVERLAMEAVHTDSRGRVLATELAALNEIAGTDRGLTAKDAREMARRTVAGMRTRDALSAGRFLAAERKAAGEVARLSATVTRNKMWVDAAARRVQTSARALVRGEASPAAVARAVDDFNAQFETTQTTFTVPEQTRTSTAGKQFTIPGGERTTTSLGFNEQAAALVEAKRRQLLNHALYSEALAVADEVQKAERLVARLAKAVQRRRSQDGKQTISNESLDAIAELIERYDFRKMPRSAEDRRGALSRYLESMLEQGRENEIAIPKRVLTDAAKVPYKTLSVADMRGVVDTLRNLESTGRRWQKLLIAKKTREMDEAVGTIVSALTDNIGLTPADWVDAGWQKSAKTGVSQYLSTFTTASTVIRKIDGRQDLGPVYELLKSDIDNAAYTEREMRTEAAEKIEALYSVYSRDEQRQMAVMRSVAALGGKSFSKWNLISMALNMGNEGNLHRLTNRKARQHLTPQQVDIVKGLLDKRDWDFVQSVWDYLDTYRPLIAERQKRVTGVEPEWVDATALETPHGTYRGGYFPIKYAREQGGASTPSLSGETDIIKSMQLGSYAKAATKNGHLETRVANVQQSLLLDVGVIATHTNEVIHDLTFSEPIVNSWRLLNDQRVSTAMLDAGLQEQHEALKLWLKDAAVGQVFASDFMSRTVRNLRSGFTVSRLAFNVGTAMLQPTGLMQSAVVVGKRNLANAIVRYSRDPKAMADEVIARSRVMSERRTTFQKDLMDMVAETNIASPTASRFKEVMNRYAVPASLAMMTYTQFYVVDVPTWAAAFDSGMRQFDGNQTKAAEYADMTINRVQGGGLWTERSGIERGTLSATVRQNAFVTLFTTLGSYFFAKMNLLIERTDAVRSGPITAGAAASYAFDVGLLLAGEAAVMMLAGAVKDGLFGGDDDDEDENPAMTLGVEAIKVLAAGLPGIRDGVSVVQGFSGGTYAGVLDLLVKPAQQAAQGEFDAALVKSFVNLAGVAARLPAAQANRIIDAGWRDLEGEDVAPMEYLFGKKR